MKKAEDYFDIMSILIYMDCDEHRDCAYKLIRMVQQDTIEETCKRCAEEAEMTGISYGNDKSITDYEVDKQSILSVADKLIKELEDGNKD